MREEIGLLTNLSLTAGARAMMLYHVFKYCSLLKTGQTPEEYVAGLGLDSVKAREEADLAGWVVKNSHHLTWPDGVNASKVALIRSAAEWVEKEGLPASDWQWWLDQARDASYSTLEADLVKDGWLPRGTTRKDLYARFRCDGVVWYDDLGDIPRDNEHYLVKVGKVFPPLRRARGKLFAKDGLIEKEIEVQ